MEEIIELVNYEITNSGYKKKLIGGIVITGGGSQLKHVTQLFEYVTGMDARIGYPNEHLANTNDLTELASPIYATGIGLVMKGFETLSKSQVAVKDDVTMGQEEPQETEKGGRERGDFFKKVLFPKITNFFKEND
jgi:cell division protein FtsA